MPECNLTCENNSIRIRSKHARIESIDYDCEGLINRRLSKFCPIDTRNIRRPISARRRQCDLPDTQRTSPSKDSQRQSHRCVLTVPDAYVQQVKRWQPRRFRCRRLRGVSPEGSDGGTATGIAVIANASRMSSFVSRHWRPILWPGSFRARNWRRYQSVDCPIVQRRPIREPSSTVALLAECRCETARPKKAVQLPTLQLPFSIYPCPSCTAGQRLRYCQQGNLLRPCRGSGRLTERRSLPSLICDTTPRRISIFRTTALEWATHQQEPSTSPHAEKATNAVIDTLRHRSVNRTDMLPTKTARRPP